MSNGTISQSSKPARDIPTVSCAWEQFSVWQRVGCGDDKRCCGVLWANDAYHAAKLARTHFGQARYQVRSANGRTILLSHC